VIKLELRNRIRTSYPHVKARLQQVPAIPSQPKNRWQIQIDGANHAHEIQQINHWAQAANVLPHLEIQA
jgi:hypothetical protein